MEPGNFAEWIGIIAALLVGIFGLTTAYVSDGRAKRANELAERSNQVAEDALRQAREANQVAKDANELSEDANSISRAQAAQMVDPAHIEWRIKWDDDRNVLTITNEGRDLATEVSVLVRAEKVNELVRLDDPVDRGESITIPLPQVGEERDRMHSSGSRIIIDGETVSLAEFTINTDVDLRWKTERGTPGVETRKLRLS